MFWTCLPQFPMVSSSNAEAVAANNAATQRTSGARARDDEQWKTNKPLLGTYAQWRISFMCARKGGYEDLTKKILRMSVIDVSNESNLFVEAQLRRTLACSFQQFHLSFHLLDLLSRFTNICLESSHCWGGHASSDEHLVGTKHGLLECRSVPRKLPENNGVDVKRSKLEGRSVILTWKWILEYLDQLRNHVEMKGCRQLRHRWKFQLYLLPAPPPEEDVPEMRAEEAMWDSSAEVCTMVTDSQ